MARFYLEHSKGVSGQDEDTIERIDVTDEFAVHGIKVFQRNGIEWEVEEFNVAEPDTIMVVAVAENPEVTNLPGSFSDYWMLVQEMTERETLEFKNEQCNGDFWQAVDLLIFEDGWNMDDFENAEIRKIFEDFDNSIDENMEYLKGRIDNVS